MNLLEHSSVMDLAKYAVAGIVASLSTGGTEAAEEKLVAVAVNRAEFATAGRGALESLAPGKSLEAGCRVKTAKGGWARLDWAQPGTITFLVTGDLGIAEMRPSVSAFPIAPFTPVDSAIKATLTHNDANVTPPRIPTRVSLRLISGELYTYATKAEVQVEFSNGVVTARAARFVVAVEAPDSTRLTVDVGPVTLIPSGGRALRVESGQAARISGTGNASVVTGPAAADGVPGGRADMIALRMEEASNLAPIAQGGDGKMLLAPIGQGKGVKEVLPPIAQGPGDRLGGGGVGNGLSAPFDLPGETLGRALLLPANPQNDLPGETPRRALLLPANPPNINPPVNSPERP